MTSRAGTKAACSLSPDTTFLQMEGNIEFRSSSAVLNLRDWALAEVDGAALGHLLERGDLTRSQVIALMRDDYGSPVKAVEDVLRVLERLHMVEQRTGPATPEARRRNLRAEISFDAPAQRAAFGRLINRLHAVGDSSTAREVAEIAVRAGLWTRWDQRPERYIAAIESKPLYDPAGFWFVKLLEQSYPKIREEFDRVMACHAADGRGLPFEIVPDPIYEGGMSQTTFFFRGDEGSALEVFPVTAQILGQIREARSMIGGTTTLSWLEPGSHIVPHCGPHNARLRLHMGIRVPSGASMRVSDTIFSWEEGRCIVFDDSFEHEVWHRGCEPRVVLILDFWHPALTDLQIAKLMRRSGRDPGRYGVGRPEELASAASS